MSSLESAILIVGIVQGLFLATTLAIKTSSSLNTNRYLIALLLAFVVALSVQWLSVSAKSTSTTKAIAFGSSVVFLFGPLLYLYVKSLVSAQTSFTHLRIVHYFPFFAYLLLVIYLVVFRTAELEITTDASLAQKSYAVLFLPLIKLLHVGCYTVFSLVLLLRYKRRIENSFSNIDNINLLWLKNLIIGFIIFECAIAIAMGLNFSGLLIPANADTLLSFILVVLIFMTGFYGMRQPTITGNLVELDAKEQLKGEQPKVSIKNLSDTDVITISNRLTELKPQNIHLDRFISLKNLSELVGVSHHKMSEYLNSHMGVTFYEYINKSRIEDAKSRLIHSHETVLDIALQVGFNNKATFNKAFKQFENLTPSEYRRQNKAHIK